MAGLDASTFAFAVFGLISQALLVLYFAALRWRHVEWRIPIKWSIFVPYVALYFWAQMFLWWPLRDISGIAWTCFLVLFVASTALNIRGHFGSDTDSPQKA